MEFVTSEPDPGCFICQAISRPRDEADLVLVRGQHAVALLNKYPYNTGHVLVAPMRHIADLTDLDAQDTLALMQLVSEVMRSLRDQMQPQGFNIGANLGEVAGAGLPGHFHMHVVPRWAGDTNFMPVTGRTKVLPEDLADTYRRLRKAMG
jgi:ATP adenylyltransferase